MWLLIRMLSIPIGMMYIAPRARAYYDSYTRYERIEVLSIDYEKASTDPIVRYDSSNLHF